MTDTLIAVLKDLWDFLWQRGETVSTTDSVTHKMVDGEAVSQIAAAVEVQALLDAPVQPTFLPAPALKVEGLYGESAYVQVREAKAFHRAVWTFDGVVKVLPYAALVTILGFEGRFARIAHEEGSLFVLKDELTLHQEDIFAEFHNGEIYSANHPDTKKVRELLRDEFFTIELCMPLLAVEFVMYRLLLAGRRIIWSSTRPRQAGQWQNLLKGKLGIQIGVLPKAGALIEYTKPDGTGFIGFTKAVHVNDAIVIEGVGRMIEGEYREELLPKEVWHELRPVFIAVT